MSDPGLLLDGEVIYSRSLLVDGCHSTDRILAIQWAFVSLGRVVDRRSFWLVALSVSHLIQTRYDELIKHTIDLKLS